MSLARNIVRAAVNLGSGTAHAVIAAQGAGTKIAVVGFDLKLDAAQTWLFESGSTALSGVFPSQQQFTYEPLIDNGQVYARFLCAANEAFNITTGAGAEMDGFVWYIVENTA